MNSKRNLYVRVDQVSELGVGSKQQETYYRVGGPSSPDHGKASSRLRPRGGSYIADRRPGESIFDRLYNHARAKQAESAQSVQRSRSSRSKPSSVGATTLSSRSLSTSAKAARSSESVFERLYAQRPSKHTEQKRIRALKHCLRQNHRTDDSLTHLSPRVARWVVGRIIPLGRVILWLPLRDPSMNVCIGKIQDKLLSWLYMGHT
jgi:hypothetical protein